MIMSDDIEIIEEDSLKDSEIEIVEASDLSEESQEDFVSEDDLLPLELIDESEAYQPVVEYSEWKSPEDFKGYIVSSLRNIPPVYDGSKNSLRRAHKYFKTIQAEMIQGIEEDAPYANLTEQHLRTFDQIEEGIEISLSQIEASINGKMVKNATKSSSFVYYVNPFLYSIARVLVNAKVSQGKNIEDVFVKLNKTYKFNDREKLELHYLLNDMGYPLRGSPVDNIDMAETYFA